jgi:uncharacterized tellurite resistance protein B-like protein
VDDSLRTEVCRLIAGILIADYELDPKEDEFLDRLFRAMRLPATERLAMKPVESRSEAAALMRRLSETARKAVLSLLFDAAKADGVIHDDERAYVHAIAEELGMAPDEVDRRLDGS